MNSLSPQAMKAMNIVLSPYEKSLPVQFSKLLTQILSEEEHFFLCLVSIMIGSPNCINYSFFYIYEQINILNKKTVKSKKEEDTNSDTQENSDLTLIALKDIPNYLPPKKIVSFWNNYSCYSNSKKDNSISHINLNAFIDLVPTFYDEKILNSFLNMRRGSFLIINYIQKLKDGKLKEFSKQIIENGSNDQIKLYIPFIASYESSPQIIENWIKEHIYQYSKYSTKYEIALTSALTSIQCTPLLPTTIDLIIINFLNGKFSVNSSIFESFFFYTQRTIRIFDRSRFLTDEDFLVTFFSTFIHTQPNLFKGTFVCPNMFTKMINSNIQIPPFSLSIFFHHLDDFLLKYTAKQFITNKDYIYYLNRCYEKSIKLNQNSYFRKVLDYSIMALFLKTTSIDTISYPIVIDMISKIKMPREEFAHFIFIQIAKMFSNLSHRAAALSIIERWRSDDVSLITRLLLSVFNASNINALINVEETICRRGGHALTALFNLASTAEFCFDKGRRALLVSIIQRLVSKINVSRLKPRTYMPKMLYDFIGSNGRHSSISSENEIGLNSPFKQNSRSKPKFNDSNSHAHNLLTPNQTRSRHRIQTISELTSISPKAKLGPKEKQSTDGQLDEQPRRRGRRGSSSNVSPLRAPIPAVSPSKQSLRKPHKHADSSGTEISATQSAQTETSNDDFCCKLTNLQLENFLIAQITTKNTNKIGTKEIITQIINRIDSLDRRHSKHRHRKASHVHKHSEESNEVTNSIIKNQKTSKDSSKKEQEAKQTDGSCKDHEESQKQEEIEVTNLNENNSNTIQKVDDEGENSNHENNQIRLSETTENEGSHFYNVIGGVMKVLFGGFGSSSSNKNDDTVSQPNFRSSLPQTITDNNNADSSKKKKSDEKQNWVDVNAKSDPLFDEIEFSSDGVMALPDEVYSSASENGYSDLNISDFDFEISDNEKLAV